MSSFKLTMDDLAIIERAKKQSAETGCTVHVNAEFVLVGGDTVRMVGLRASDWYVDGSTLKSFTKGQEH